VPVAPGADLSNTSNKLKEEHDVKLDLNTDCVSIESTNEKVILDFLCENFNENY
jgi:hypothetical protein